MSAATDPTGEGRGNRRSVGICRKVQVAHGEPRRQVAYGTAHDPQSCPCLVRGVDCGIEQVAFAPERPPQRSECRTRRHVSDY